MSQGQKFRQAIVQEKPLQLVGTINAYTAMMAKEIGFRAIYLSGAGVANNCFGLPDTGIIGLEKVLEETHRLLSAVDLPLIVDIDTGFENIADTINAIEQAGAAGVHIEDQVFNKRCGHLEGKKLVSQEEMCLRIKQAISSKTDSDFFIIARTDAFAVDGLTKAVDLAKAYEEAGADALFPEGLMSLSQYEAFKKALKIPILANITEFGKTPLFTIEELKSVGVDIVLYPLSASRAMNLAALNVYKEIKEKGTQQNMVRQMQTRKELYHFLKYEP